MFVGEKTTPAALFGLHSLLVLFTAGKLPECTDQRGVVQRSREEKKEISLATHRIGTTKNSLKLERGTICWMACVFCCVIRIIVYVYCTQCTFITKFQK